MTNPTSQQEINAAAWAACDTFRGVVDPAQYKDYILVMLFLKYISDLWSGHYEEYRKEYGNNEERIRRKLERERFILPYVEFKDEKTGKVEERMVKVDTPFDSGPTIELEAANLPKYGLQLNRQMWTCTKKSEDEIKKLPKEHSVQQECNYTYDLNFSFNDLKAYIDGQEAERARVAEANTKMREAQAEFQKALESGDTVKLQALVTQ